MMTPEPVTVRIWGGTVKVEPSDPDGTEAAIAAYLSSVNVASESAAPFARSAAGIIDGFEFELCAECLQDLDMHELGPGPMGLAHAWCLKCTCCGHVSAAASEAIAHYALKWKVNREADAAGLGCFDSEPAASAFIGTLPGHVDGLYGIDAPAGA